MLSVEADRFDHEVEPVGTVDLARNTVGRVGPYELSFGEVIEPVDTPRVAILEQKHRIRKTFRPRE